MNVHYGCGGKVRPTSPPCFVHPECGGRQDRRGCLLIACFVCLKCGKTFQQRKRLPGKVTLTFNGTQARTLRKVWKLV